MKRLFVFLTLILQLAFAYAQDGVLDEQYASDGKLLYKLSDCDLKINDAVLMGIDRLVVVGKIKYVGAVNEEIFFKVFNIDNSPVNGFGIEHFMLENVDHEATSVGVLSNGKIVIAGNIYDNGKFKFFVCRLNTDGTLDPTFFDGGYKIFQIGVSQFANCLVVDKNDNVFIGGRVFTGSSSDAFVMKIAPDGSPDPDFGVDGLFIHDFGLGNEYIYTMELFKDGSIILAGDAESNNTSAFFTCKVKSNGSVDNSFGKNGGAIKLVGEGNNSAEDISLQEDGKIVLVGYALQNNKNQIAACRFNANGTIDNDFGQNGSIIQKVGSNEEYATSSLIQEDSKLIIGANISTNSIFDFGLLRFDSNGQTDITFGSNGITKTNFDNGRDELAALLKVSSNSIMAIGSQSANNKSAVLIAKYTIKNSTSTADIESSELVKAYPNPYDESIYIDTDLSINQVELLSLSGRSWPIHLEVNRISNVEHLPSGIYMLKLYGDQWTKTIKVWKR